MKRALLFDAGTEPAQVLIVDDRPTSREVLKSVLGPPKYRTTEARGGREALALVAAERFDLVILDVVMPDIDGFEVLKTIREQYTHLELPVIIVTVKDAIWDVVQGLEFGANDYVTKPIEPPVLLARSKAQLSRKRAEDALRAAHADLERLVARRTAELVEANKALRKSRETLRLSEKRYRALYDYTPSMFFTIDPTGILVSANDFAAEQLGYSLEELVGMPAARLYDTTSTKTLHGNLEACLTKPEGLHRCELKMLRKRGEPIWVRQTARVVHDVDHARRIFVVCEDVTEAHALAEQLSYQASHDDLTGLLNRRAFIQLLRTALESARAGEVHHALCYIDLDQFKVINDTCGHVAGDALLRQLGPWLREHIRVGDKLARLGGDEFGVLLEDCSLAQAREVADMLRRAIEAFRFQWEDKTFTVYVSIGLVPITRSTPSISNILSSADTACYAAKEEGRNRIHSYQEDDTEIARRRGEMQWVVRINRALEENRLRLYFQPIVRLDEDSRVASHYELLLQMRDEDGQAVMPGSFMPAAERYNVSTKLDRWVVSTVFAWLSRRLESLTDATQYSINLSGQSLGDGDFLQFVLEQFDSMSIPPQVICFEVTETAAITNLASATSFMRSLTQRGCKFALDDFGIGLCSFAYLKALPVDYLKIDGAFVKNIVNNPIDFGVVRAINEIAQVMGKETIAEFVENDDILRLVRGAGVNYGQGNGIGRPQPIEKLG